MAKQYTPGQIRIASTPNARLSGSNVSAGAESFGAATARDLQGFGGALTDTATQWQNEINKTKVRDALNTARTQAREEMNRLTNLRGKDALDVYEQAQKSFEKMGKGAHSNLKNPVQAKMFDAAFSQMANNELDQALNHQTREALRYNIQTLDAENENELQDALTNPARASEHLQAIRANTRHKLQLLGMDGDEETRKRELRSANTSFHMAMVDKLAQGSAADALDYLRDKEGDIDQGAFEKAKANLTRQKEREDAIVKEDDLRRDALSILAKMGDAPVDQLRAEVNKKYKKNDEAEFVWSVMATEKNIQAQAERKRLGDLVESNWNTLYSNPNPSMASIPNDPEIPVAERMQMQRYVAQLQEARGKGMKDIPPNNSLYLHYMTLPVDELSQMNATDVAALRATMPKADFERIRQRYTESKSASRTPEKNAMRLQTPLAYAKERMNALGLDEAQKSALLREAELLIETQQPKSYKELDEVLGSLMVKGFQKQSTLWIDSLNPDDPAFAFENKKGFYPAEKPQSVSNAGQWHDNKVQIGPDVYSRVWVDRIGNAVAVYSYKGDLIARYSSNAKDLAQPVERGFLGDAVRASESVFGRWNPLPQSNDYLNPGE